MSGRTIQKGATNVSSVVRIIDSTAGTPETGVVAATTGLAFNYRREGEAVVAITALNDLALLTTAHTDGGILHIGNGYYRIDFQDTAFALGAGEDGVLLTGTATGMIVIGTYHPLVDHDPVGDIETIASDLVLAQTDLDTITSDLVVIDDFLDTEIASLTSNLVIVDTVVDTIASDLILAQTDLDTTTSDLVVLTTTQTAQTSNLVIIASDTLAIEVDTSTTLSAQVTTIASDLVLAQTDLDTLTSDTAAIEVDTGTTLSAQITTIASDLVLAQTDLDTITSDLVVIDDFLDTEIASLTSNLVIVASDTVHIESDAILASTLFTTALTEAYAADGAAPTPAQALMQIQQMLTEKTVSATTVTIKKLDGSTTAFTLTLNDGTSPTSITRAT